MVDIELLKAEIESTLIPVTKICEKAEWKGQTYYNRLNHPENFTVSEIEGLCEACNWSAVKRRAIFFAKTSE